MDSEKIRKLLETLDYGPAPESDKKVREWLTEHNHSFDHFIGGEWRKPANGTYFQVLNPANKEILAYVAEGTTDDVNAAMESAQKAFPLWNSLSGFERAKYLYAIARIIAKHSRKFAVLESLNNGKTIRETRDIDIPLVIRHFYYHAGWAIERDEEFPNHKPGGVVGQIIPWNFPLLMLAWKIAPAIAAGNTVVIKPAEFTPLTAMLFAEILKEANLPQGVVNIVNGGAETGELIVKHPIPWKIAFTGSTEVGRKIRQVTAGSGKRLTMELGGKSPFVVFESADLDSAVEGVVNAIFFNQGHVCCAGSRLLIQENIYEEFIAKLKRRMNKLRIGDPLDKAVDIGAINSQAQLNRIKKLVQAGKDEGATIWQPECVCPTNGYFFPPTIFTKVQPSSTIAQVEIFGPVLVCMSFRTPQEAIELANNTRYGLAASVWTQDVSMALDAARQIKAGTVWINSTNLFDAVSGFGGYRESGYGREGGREGMEEVVKEVFPLEDHKDRWRNCYAEAGVLAQAIGIEREGVDRTYRFLIGGQLVRPDEGYSFSVKTELGEFRGVVGNANRKDVRNAVEAARKAASGWEYGSNPHLRAQILYFWAENLSAQKYKFIRSVSGSYIEGRYWEAMAEVEKSIERIFYYAAMADKYEGRVQPVPGRMTVIAAKEPVGVIGMRASDQFPLLGAISLLAPAIAMGNTIVLVAGKNPLPIMELVQTIQNSDIPAGVVNILTAENPDEIAKILAEHEDGDSVWCFSQQEACVEVERASVGNMKRVWTNWDDNFDWFGRQGQSRRFLREATQVKNIWIPYGY